MSPPRNVLGILAESENVYPEQRALVERMFGTRYFSSYGQTEKLVAAAECEYSSDYHVWPTYGYFELLDAAQQPVTAPGQIGEIVGTGFINSVIPFIRYRTGDFARYVGVRCGACGREQSIIADIRGHRMHETLVTKTGQPIAWTALNVHDDTFDRVERFQFVQSMPGRAVLKLAPARGFTDTDRRRIAETLAVRLDHQIDLDIEITAAIPVTDRGKAVYVDQRIPSMRLV
jgi:phenylacetate-CoA ligase